MLRYRKMSPDCISLWVKGPKVENCTNETSATSMQTCSCIYLVYCVGFSKVFSRLSMHLLLKLRTDSESPKVVECILNVLAVLARCQCHIHLPPSGAKESKSRLINKRRCGSFRSVSEKHLTPAPRDAETWVVKQQVRPTAASYVSSHSLLTVSTSSCQSDQSCLTKLCLFVLILLLYVQGQ